MSATATYERTPEHLRLEAGAEVGHYGITEHMATTGMSVVYEAVNLADETSVALKLPINDGKAARHLRQEIVHHSRYSHLPTVVTIDGCGVWREQPFLATRLQTNGTLADEIDTTRQQAVSANPPDSGIGSWAQRIIDELEQDIFGEDTYALVELNQDQGSLGQGELGRVVRSLSAENIGQLVTDTEDLHAETVVGVVAGAAEKHGHIIDPESPLAKQATKMLLEQEVQKEETATVTTEITAEVLDAETIRKRLKVIGDVATAAAALGRGGVVHRDIKPGNISIGDDGRGLLLDFGIATEKESDTGGMVFGSEGNIPPEAYLGTVVPAGDAFAVSRAAYLSLTGHEPYKVGSDNQENYYRILEGEVVSLREFNGDIAPDVDRIILEGLGKQHQVRATAATIARVFELHS